MPTLPRNTLAPSRLGRAAFTLRLRNFRTRWTSWEYWPMWLANLPVIGMYAYFAARARHGLFFTAANPAIPLGGAFGESKYDILQRIPAEILPKTLLSPAGESFDALLVRVRAAGLDFPLVAKPDVGERGFLVKKIANEFELAVYRQQHAIDVIVQEFVSLPVEMTVLFHRYPGADGHFAITSVCAKDFLQITGDGQRTVAELMAAQPRAALQIERLRRLDPALMERVLPADAGLALEPIGNHNRGTKFVDARHAIDPALTTTFHAICRRIDGIHYGRFDLKCASIEALKRGEFRVLELNGVLGEPAHVYDPAVGAWRAYGDLFRHWRIIFRVSQAQRRAGIRPQSLREGWAVVRWYWNYKKRLEE